MDKTQGILNQTSKAYLFWLRVALTGALALPFVVMACSGAGLYPVQSALVLICVAALAFYLNKYLRLWLGRVEPAINRLAQAQTSFLDNMPRAALPAAIMLAAALSLFLELVVIRWQSTAFEFFAFYKNFGLMACFAGLGLGYALTSRQGLVAAATPFLLFLQVLLLTVLRHGMPLGFIRSLMAMPFSDQVGMGLGTASQWTQHIAIYSLLAVVYALTCLAFVPVGQLCGRLMSRHQPLAAYGYNLLGSLAGIVALFLLSWAWTPPAIWFATAFLVLSAFLVYSRKVMLFGSIFSLATLCVLTWPVTFSYEVVYSPYQILERGPGAHGLSEVRAAGQYYQRINDLSLPTQSLYADAREKANYYDLPYKLRQAPRSVAIVGAGSGNDIAAALRAGASRVVAIEIDPAIMEIGKQFHPERPYSDSRVVPIVGDARTFLRRTGEKFDLIVFGLLDSHTLLSHASGLRLDSYVYTVEALKEARSRLNDGGLVSLTFACPSREIAKKIYLMMTAAFDGHPPVCIATKYDIASVAFLQNKEATLSVPDQVWRRAGFNEVSYLGKDPSVTTSVATDDWPFLYMPKRVLPLSYLPMISMVLLISFALIGSFGGAVNFHGITFFLLGAGFMLVETKAITELSLDFGSTWWVTGIVIAAILLMAFLGNLLVEKARLSGTFWPAVFLVASLAGGYAVAGSAAVGSGPAGQWAATGILTCPLFFSGMIFSLLIARSGDIGTAMSMNLLGAICGGLLEYIAMYSGYRALYPLAIALYALAMLSTRIKPAPAGSTAPLPAPE